MMNGCEGYQALAGAYDLLNGEVDYERWAAFVERCFDRFLTARPELVLDLACGTGRMTRALAERGYDMIGVDGSAEMLSEAYAAGQPTEGRPILYLCQDMRELELYGTVGAAVCCLDSINYLLEESDVLRVFRLVHNYLDPDGLFLFDVNTPYKFEHIYGNNAYVLENESKCGAVLCAWQNEFNAQSGICDFYLSLFEEQTNGSYARSDEHQQERCYAKETLCALLEQAGFELLGCFADFDGGAPTEQTERWYFAARAIKRI